MRIKPRNKKYEQKFRAYLFGFDFKTHKEICKDLNVLHIENRADYKKAFNILRGYFDSLPDEEKPKIDKQLKKLNL